MYRDMGKHLKGFVTGLGDMGAYHFFNRLSDPIPIRNVEDYIHHIRISALYCVCLKWGAVH